MPDSTVTISVAANLLLIALGYLVKRVGLLSRDDGRTVNRLVLYLTLPAVNVLALARAHLSWHLLLPPVTLLLAALLICFGGGWVARRLALARQDRGTFLVSLCGLMLSMAYPFFEAGYGEEGVRAVAVCDLGNAVVVFAFAYALSFHYARMGQLNLKQIIVKIATFPPIYAMLVGLVLNVARIEIGGLPAALLGMLARANSPLMLLSLGLYLDLNISLREARVLIVHALYKYGVGVVLAALLTWLLPVHGALAAAVFLTPLMPSTMSTLLYAAEQGLNPRLAAMLVSSSMVISLGIITVAMLWLRSLF